jgi:xylulokinase
MHTPAAVAITGQMKDLILLDADGRPTHPVVLYSDTQAHEELAALTAANPAWQPSIAVTPPPGPDALPPKILRVARRSPDALAASRTMLLSAAGWLSHALMGVSVCDRLTASTTGLYDPRTDDWLALLATDGAPLIPAHLDLPQLVDPGIVGHVHAAAARNLGVPAGTPVVMALGDAGAATDGMVGSTPGSTYLHLGTTGWVAHVDPTPAADLPVPRETGETPDRHRVAHPAGHLAIARLPEAGEALERARRDLLGLTDPHSPDAHAIAEAALSRARTAAAAAHTWEDAPGDGEDVGSIDDSGSQDDTPADVPAGTSAAADRAYAEVVAGLARDAAALLDRLSARPSRLPVTGGVVRSSEVRRLLESTTGLPVDLVPDVEAGLRSCARVAFDALGTEHTIAPLVHG